PNALVVEGLLLVVDAEVPHVGAHLLEHRDPAALLELTHVVGRRADDEVEGAGEQLGQPCLVLDDGPVDDALNLYGVAPVARVLFEHDLLATVPRAALEGAGA